jgi:hypothetical protein
MYRALLTCVTLAQSFALAVPAAGHAAPSNQTQPPVPAPVPPPPPPPERDATTAFDSNAGPGFLLPGLQVTANVDGAKTAQLTLSALRDTDHRIGQTQLGVTFSAPFDNEDTHRGVLLTQRGLPSGFAAEGSFSRVISFDPHVSRNDGPPRRADTGPRFLDRSIVVLNGTVGIGVDQFKYRDPATFGELDQWRTSVSFSGSLGLLPAGSATFFGAGFEFRRRFEAPDKRILCPTPAPPAPLECRQAVFGPPEREEDATAFGVVRTLDFFGVARNGVPFALELRAAYDFDDNEFAVEAPLYFFLDDKSRYRGGFSVSWSNRDHWGIGFFVGVPLDFLNLNAR